MPIIGWLIGGASGIAFFYTAQYFSTFTAAIVSLCISLLFSGAIHEKQWTHWCETLGRSRELINPNEKQATTSPSTEYKVGIYGLMGLLMALLLKVALIDDTFFLHGYLRDEWIIVTLIFMSAHTLSRFAINSIVYFGVDAETPKHASRIGTPLFLLSGILALAPLLALIKLSYSPHYLLLLPPLALLTWRVYDHCKRHSGGYTREALGAAQQTNELIFYAIFALIL